LKGVLTQGHQIQIAWKDQRTTDFFELLGSKLYRQNYGWKGIRDFCKPNPSRGWFVWIQNVLRLMLGVLSQSF